MNAADVLSGKTSWSVEQGDCLAWLASLPADSVDLCVFSPPYEKARTYGIDFNVAGQAWVDWMVQVFTACRRVCRGLVVCVCEGQTNDYRYSAVPLLLAADLHRAGHNLRKCPIYHRVGIPGSGGPDWLRNDYEFCICTTRPGRLPWSDNTACGHPPKWAPGGEMSNRQSNGARVNAFGMTGIVEKLSKDGTPGKQQGVFRKRRAPNGHKNGDMTERDSYSLPAIANPGNVIEDAGHLVSCKVGGGLMAESDLIHENEAPYPEKLAQFFILNFCPPGGVCLDCFSGSGTTAAVAVREGRRFIGCDVRESQVSLTRRRLDTETPLGLFA